MYPPGIPLIVPGEVWNKDLIKRVQFFEEHKQDGVKLLRGHKDGFEVIDIERWRRYSVYERRLQDYFRNKKTTPIDDGYSLPFEGENHEGTIVLLPYRLDTWRNKARPAQKTYKEVIKAISQHEKVYVGIHPKMWDEFAHEYEEMDNVEPIKIRYNDAWARDNMPLFVRNCKGDIRTVDFRFNAWGGEVDGLYKNWKDDDKASAAISKKLQYSSYYVQNFILQT